MDPFFEGAGFAVMVASLVSLFYIIFLLDEIVQAIKEPKEGEPPKESET